ncbi:sigma-54-dependent transcriptional regulator [Halioxenophilus aromaticivorans]|uniref:Sigma-54 dependent transcriptional regulator n=1 Tax=Halioxenophilus aromaticivorans TaxID=1306992 RepID=A0AAV3U2Y5_9ALTE
MSKVLLVDDDSLFTDATSELIKLLGHTVEIASTAQDANQRLNNEHFDVLMLDIMLPDGNGFDILHNLSAESRPPKVAFITGHSAIKSMVNSIAGPGVSYLLKPIDLASIEALLSEPEDATDSNAHFGVLVGESPVIKKVYNYIERVAPTRANVMIMGESGTGKELVAQAIHNASKCSGAMVAANCGAFSPELLSSELFGHEKGSFTGATSRKIGLFEQAKGGTLFLDEVTEMPIDMQPTLLRVLETGMLRRVGGTEDIPIDCRVISATNRSRDQLATEQCLREDIYFRLAVFPIDLPPLRNRGNDVSLLADYFVAHFNKEQQRNIVLTDDVKQRLIDYNWPGNIRELRHTLYRAFILTDSTTNTLSLPQEFSSPFAESTTSQNALTAGTTIQEMERQLITVTLEQVDGDKPTAAKMLGISLKTLYNRLNQYE